MPKPSAWKWPKQPPWVRSYDKFGENHIRIAVGELTFAQLTEVSEMFGTKKINVGSETRSGGYCETCEYSYSVAVLDVMEVTQWPSDQE